MRKTLLILVWLFAFFSCEKPLDKDEKFPDTDFNHRILEDYFVKAIAFDSQGNAWIGTFKDGLIKYNSRETVVYTSENSALPENAVIWDVEVDSKGNVWVGTEGLLKFDGSEFTLYNSKNTDMPEDFVADIEIDSKDNIWFTSCRFKQGGIVKYDGENWNVYTPENSELPTHLVHSIAVDLNDDVWLAVADYVNDAFLVRISDREWKTFGEAALGFRPYYYGNIRINSKNEVCAAIDYSLSSMFSNVGPQIFIFRGGPAEQLSYDTLSFFRSISIDHQDNIWGVGMSGYAVYNGKDWFSDNSTFREISIFCIEQAPDKRMWMGTGAGIYIN